MTHASAAPVRASVTEILSTLAKVVVPTLAKGVIIRRRTAVGLAERLGLDTAAVRHMQRLRDRHGGRPLLFSIAGLRYLILLDGGDVIRVLDGAPEPFASASSEKRAALAHFEPRNVLASHGRARAVRRAANEQALEIDAPAHSLKDVIDGAARAEMEAALAEASADPHRGLDWAIFNRAWHRLVRRLVFGDAARGDDALTDLLARLRGRANWAFAAPRNRPAMQAFHDRAAHYLAQAGQQSLAGRLPSQSRDDETAPTHQIAQWLFAFEPAGMATFRALALLATHPREKGAALAEAGSGGKGPYVLPYLRACFLESLRLWPTTPAILRETTRETGWGGETLPPETGILIYAPFFHRDAESDPKANRFQPDLWLDPCPAEDRALVPFSHGPGLCPARNLVPLTAACALARLLKAEPRMREADRLQPGSDLPGTLDHFALAFDTAPVS